MSDEPREGERRVGLLPVHGFVLAGGKSSRMGVDKALLEVGGRPMVEVAVEKLRGFCAEVSIAGNRDDLGRFAPVVREERVDAGPAAGIEAGLKVCVQPWAMFVPVDVPLVPGELLQGWAEAVCSGSAVVSYLRTGESPQPSFCMLRRNMLPGVSGMLENGVGWLRAIFEMAGDGLQVVDAGAGAEVERWFLNVNTREDWKTVEEFLRGPVPF